MPSDGMRSCKNRMAGFDGVELFNRIHRKQHYMLDTQVELGTLGVGAMPEIRHRIRPGHPVNDLRNFLFRRMAG